MVVGRKDGDSDTRGDSKSTVSLVDGHCKSRSQVACVSCAASLGEMGATLNVVERLGMQSSTKVDGKNERTIQPFCS